MNVGYNPVSGDELTDMLWVYPTPQHAREGTYVTEQGFLKVDCNAGTIADPFTPNWFLDENGNLAFGRPSPAPNMIAVKANTAASAAFEMVCAEYERVGEDNLPIYM